MINHPKAELSLTKELEFLGFMVNSTQMEIRLPGEKIRTETGKALQSPLQSPVSALTLSRLIGKMNAETQAIPMAPLYYRNLHTCLREALQEDQSYSSVIALTEEARQELEWWKDHFTEWNGRSLIMHSSSLRCLNKGRMGSVQWVRTGGPCNPQERVMHINCFELLAAQIVIKCFAKNKSNLTIHL